MNLPTRKCAFCGAEFTPNSWNQLYCPDNPCGDRARVLRYRARRRGFRVVTPSLPRSPLEPTIVVTAPENPTPEQAALIKRVMGEDKAHEIQHFTPPTNPTPDQIAYLTRILGDEYTPPTKPQPPTEPTEPTP